MMAVPFSELAGSPQETFGRNGITCERNVLVCWADRYEFVQEVLGFGDAAPG